MLSQFNSALERIQKGPDSIGSDYLGMENLNTLAALLVSWLPEQAAFNPLLVIGEGENIWNHGPYKETAISANIWGLADDTNTAFSYDNTNNSSRAGKENQRG